jgi:hypothetical protein
VPALSTGNAARLARISPNVSGVKAVHFAVFFELAPVQKMMQIFSYKTQSFL